MSSPRPTFSFPLDHGRCWVDARVARQLHLPTHEQSLRELVDRLLQRFDSSQGTSLKDDRHSHVRVVQDAAHRFIVKRYPDRGKRTKMRAYHLLRRTLAWREWRGVRRLVGAGRRANAPLALVHQDHGRGVRQLLVLPFVEGTCVAELLCGEPSVLREQVAAGIGRQVGLLAAAGWHNSDLKPGNLIVDERCRTRHDEPVLIDPTSIRRGGSRRAVLKSLRHLLRTSRDVGTVTPRERLACLRAARRAFPRL